MSERIGLLIKSSILDFMYAQGREEDREMYAADVGQFTESDRWQNSDETQQIGGIWIMTLLLRRAQQPKTYLKSPACFQVISFLHCTCSGLTWNTSCAPSFGNVCPAEG